jgi:hypothetical protein
VDWGTLAGAALGAVVGAGSTMAADRSRWKRDHSTRERVARRELYSQYLAVLSLATHQLRDVRRVGPTKPEGRARRAGEVLSLSGAYQLRYQMLITAPEALEGPSEQAFRALRNLRDCVDEPEESKGPGWDDAIAAMNDAIAVLKSGMRDDLSSLA